jgi:hypothetical protein
VRAFSCGNCGQLVFFENSSCLRCGADLAFDWSTRELVTGAAGRCGNATLADCNWLAPVPEELCPSCVLTRTRPADDDQSGLARFRIAEAAKRRLLFGLGELGLRVDRDLAFDFLSSSTTPVTTGHADGVITLDLAESDDPHREMMRRELDEPYRTVLGTLRHEAGHYYWPRLVVEGPARERFRALFGDERSDYGAARERHYAEGPPADWTARYVSAYAAMHPWEDWAETFAHVLHIADTLQTTASYGLRLHAANGDVADPAEAVRRDFHEQLDDWLPLTYALNAINRSMGRDDLYPFVIVQAATEKLVFAHGRIVGSAAPAPS